MYKLSARDLHAHFVKGVNTAESIVDYFLKRIEKYDRQIGSFLVVYEENARKRARYLDQKKGHQGSLWVS